MSDVLTIGETMVIFQPETTGPFRHVHGFRKSIGGAESNVAIGLARLGCSATWVSCVSGDEMGAYVLSAIRAEGVATGLVRRREGGFTGMMVKERPAVGDPQIYFYRKGSAASTFLPEEFPLEALAQTRILHMTGIFPALSHSCLETARLAMRAARAAGVKVSFDPNLRRKLWTVEEARPVLLELAAMADILLPGLDEAELLVGQGTPEEMAERLLGLGPRIVAIKLGPEGALVADREAGTLSRVAGTPLTPVDTVGAGDAFAAAFLAGLLEGRGSLEAAARGCAAGALATQVLGDYEGLPFRSQLDSFLSGQGPITR